MKKTLKNYQILDLLEAFTKIGKTKIVSNKRFSYALVLNDEAIKPHVKAMNQIATPDESYIEYEEERNKILREYAEVDGDGNIVLNDQQGVVFRDGTLDDVKASIDALNEKHTDIIDKRNKDIEEYNELIMTDVEINIETVSIDDIPDAIGEDVFLMKLIMPMIG